MSDIIVKNKEINTNIKDIYYKICEVGEFTNNILYMDPDYGIVTGYDASGIHRTYCKYTCMICGHVFVQRDDHIINKGYRKNPIKIACPGCWVPIDGVINKYAHKVGVYLVSLKPNNNCNWMKVGKTTDYEKRFSPVEKKHLNIKQLFFYPTSNFSYIERRILTYLGDNNIIKEKREVPNVLKLFNGITESFPCTEKFNILRFEHLAKKFELELNEKFSNLKKEFNKKIENDFREKKLPTIYGPESVIDLINDKTFITLKEKKEESISKLKFEAEHTEPNSSLYYKL
jgi:hypothetical protein